MIKLYNNDDLYSSIRYMPSHDNYYPVIIYTLKDPQIYGPNNYACSYLIPASSKIELHTPKHNFLTLITDWWYGF
jgi:hypothetical protein